MRLALDQPTLDFLQGPPPSDALEKNAFADRTQMTNTDRIALLQTHAMHVFSTAQVRVLLGQQPRCPALARQRYIFSQARLAPCCAAAVAVVGRMRSSSWRAGPSS